MKSPKQTPSVNVINSDVKLVVVYVQYQKANWLQQFTKQAISLAYRLPTWHCPHLLLNAVLGRRCCWAPAAAAVDRYLPPAGRSAANPSHPAAVDRWDRRADVGGLRTIDRFIDREPATYDAGSVNTSGDSDVISFHIYSSWFKRHLVGKTLRDVCCFAVT